MQTSNNDIIITDWAGNIMFEGHRSGDKVQEIIDNNDIEDIYLDWQNEDRTDNVWEYV